MNRLMWSTAAAAACVLGCGGGDTASHADVSIAVTGPARPVSSAATAQIVITVTNAGPAAARDLTVRPALSPRLYVQAVTCTASAAVICPSPTSIDNVYNVPTLPAGASLSFRLDVGMAGPQSGAITSLPTVAAANDLSLSNNTAVAVIQAFDAALQVSGAGPAATVTAGASAAYTMTIVNRGPDTAHDVHIDAWADSGQLITSIVCTPGGGATCPTELGARLLVPQLPAGGDLRFDIVAAVPESTSGPIANGMLAYFDRAPPHIDHFAWARGTADFALPATANYVHLTSTPDDFIGQGITATYTQANASLRVVESAGELAVFVEGDQWWSGQLSVPTGQTKFETGTYANLQGPGSRSATTGAIFWGGEGRGCGVRSGAFTVDSVAYASGVLDAIRLRFEQICAGWTSPLRGELRWSRADTTAPPGPARPAPPGLWSPPANAPAPNGSYVFLVSDVHDYIGRGGEYTYTRANATLSVSEIGGVLTVRVDGKESWTGNFQAMSGLPQLQPGYYGQLQRHPFHNPARGGLDWAGQGNGCNESSSWLVIDRIARSFGALSAVDLRFEQHCENGVAALRGKVHWVQ